jgi:acyl-CoA oxidase
VPKSQDPTSLVARHEQAMIHELRQMLSEQKHRPGDINAMVLPQCLPLIEAVGQRMAIEAAEAAGVDTALVDVFRASVIERDPAWYAQHGLGRAAQAEFRRKAIARAMLHVDRHVRALDVEAYLTAPIVSDESWDDFKRGLPAFGQDPPILARM